MTRPPKVPELDTPRTVERTVKQPRLRYIDKQTHPTGGIVHVLKTAGYGLIERMSAGGRNLASIAAALGVSGETFLALRKRDPEAQEAVERGRAALGDELVDILLTHARAGHVVAAIYLTKTMCGFVEGQPIEGARPAVNVNIMIPPPMSDAEFRAIIEGQCTVVPEAEALPGPSRGGVVR